MILSGPNVDLVSAVADDWDYVLKVAERHELVKCSPELVLDFARVNNFIMFIVQDKDKEKLGCVFSNYLPGHGFTVDLYVGEGNSGYIPECFDLFAEFMAQFTDRLYGYIIKGDKKMLQLGEIFGFQTIGEADGYIVTMREI